MITDRKIRLFVSLLLVLIIVPVLAACGGEEATPTPAPTNTPAATNTPVPTNTPAPTNTPEPTNTPVPTDTPEPTPTEESKATEGALLYGDTVTGEIDAAGPSVWSFIGLEGEAIDLIVRPTDSSLDVVVDILDETGASILDGEVDDSFDTEEILGLIVPASGEFFISLRGYGESTGAYELTIAEAGTIASGGFAAEGSLAYGDTVSSSVVDESDSVWTFSGKAGDMVNITVSPLGDDLDVVVDVLDASGDSILPNGEVDDAFGTEELLGVMLPSSGVFSITSRGFAGSTGDYQLTLAVAGGVSGDLIAYGTSVAGNIVSAEAAAWNFAGTEGDYVDITVVNLDDEFDLVVDVLDASGLSILIDGPRDDSFDTEYIRVLRLPATEVYTISIVGYEGATGEYELTLGLSNNGLPGSFIFAADVLAEEEEAHAFPFTAAAGDVVTIHVDPEFELDVVVEVWDDDADEKLDEVDFTFGFEEMLFTVPEDGNYYFQVVGFEGSTGSYDVTLLGSEDVLFELAIDDLVVGRLGPGSFIEYIYGGTAGETIEVSAETDDEIDLVISIVDADDNILQEIDETLTGESELLVYTPEEDGLVFIRVRDFFESEGEFFLTIGPG